MEPIVLAEREASSMTSHWTEYLCIRLNEDGSVVLFTGRYTALADAADYFDEESRAHDLPSLIDGQDVIGVEDDYVVGGELSYFEDEEAVDITEFRPNAVDAWLTESGWIEDVSLQEVKQARAKVEA